jgi:hypothetical protein
MAGEDLSRYVTEVELRVDSHTDGVVSLGTIVGCSVSQGQLAYMIDGDESMRAFESVRSSRPSITAISCGRPRACWPWANVAATQLRAPRHGSHERHRAAAHVRRVLDPPFSPRGGQITVTPLERQRLTPAATAHFLTKAHPY